MPPRTAQAPRTRRRRRTPRYNVAGSLVIDETGVIETATRLFILAERASDPETIKTAAQPVYDAEKRLFASHGAGHWKATKPETTAEKRKKGLRTEPMRATDTTYQSVTRPPSELPAGKKRFGILAVRKRGTELRIGTKTVAAVMQKRAGRNALIVDDQGRREVVQALTRRLLDA